MKHILACLALSSMAIFVPTSASAADEEIEVYTDSLNAKHELGLDIHMNYVATGQPGIDYAGQEQSLHRFRVTPEFTYGLGHNIEVGAYVPLLTLSGDGQLRAQGAIARIKWIAPHKEGDGFFWGGNFEIGRVSSKLDENPWSAEVKGIAGVHKGPWTVAVNANINFKVEGPEPAPASLKLLGKVSYRVSPKLAIGVESYHDIGEFKSLGHLDQNDQSSFIVMDTKLGKWNLHSGVGMGYGGNRDTLILLLGIGVPLG